MTKTSSFGSYTFLLIRGTNITVVCWCVVVKNFPEWGLDAYINILLSLSLSLFSLSLCAYRLLLDDLVLAPCDAVHATYVNAACTKTCTFQIVCANVAASGPKPAMAIKGNIKACPTAQIFNAVLSFGPAVNNPYATAQSMHPNMRDIICHHHHHHHRERDGLKKKRAFLMSHLFLCKKKRNLPTRPHHPSSKSTASCLSARSISPSCGTKSRLFRRYRVVFGIIIIIIIIITEKREGSVIF